LPFERIQRADKLGEIDFQENPAPSGLGTRNQATFGARTNFFGVHVQKCGGFVQIERSRSESFGMDIAACRAARSITYLAQRASISTNERRRFNRAT
jgi:hypothetical protein